jgi:hypothetical protein
VKLRRGETGSDEITITAQKAIKPSFELNIDTVTNWDGSIRFVDRGEIGDRYGGELSFVGTIAKIDELHQWIKRRVLEYRENIIEFTDFATDEKPFGAYVDYSEIIIGSVKAVTGMEYRTNTTAEIKMTITLSMLEKISGTSVDFSHEVHGSRSEEYFEGLWSLVEHQNRLYNTNVSTTDQAIMYTADYIFTDADVCGLISHLTTNRGLPLQSRNIYKIECVNRIGLKYWQYRIWWV